MLLLLIAIIIIINSGGLQQLTNHLTMEFQTAFTERANPSKAYHSGLCQKFTEILDAIIGLTKTKRLTLKAFPSNC